MKKQFVNLAGTVKMCKELLNTESRGKSLHLFESLYSEDISISGKNSLLSYAYLQENKENCLEILKYTHVIRTQSLKYNENCKSFKPKKN
jgi:hypothetical protein